VVWPTSKKEGGADVEKNAGNKQKSNIQTEIYHSNRNPSFKLENQPSNRNTSFKLENQH